MGAPKNLATQEPGTEPAAAETQATETTEATEQAAEPADDLATLRAENDRLIELTTVLRAEISRRDATLQNIGITLPTYAESEENKLPDVSEIDATTITQSVLTKQGWVLPAVKD